MRWQGARMLPSHVRSSARAAASTSDLVARARTSLDAPHIFAPLAHDGSSSLVVCTRTLEPAVACTPSGRVRLSAADGAASRALAGCALPRRLPHRANGPTTRRLAPPPTRRPRPACSHNRSERRAATTRRARVRRRAAARAAAARRAELARALRARHRRRRHRRLCRRAVHGASPP